MEDGEITDLYSVKMSLRQYLDTFCFDIRFIVAVWPSLIFPR